jgi:hypothetical protein
MSDFNGVSTPNADSCPAHCPRYFLEVTQQQGTRFRACVHIKHS